MNPTVKEYNKLLAGVVSLLTVGAIVLAVYVIFLRCGDNCKSCWD